MQPQTLPSLARRYHREQIARLNETLAEVEALQRSFGTRFDAGWSLIRASVVAEIEAAQADMVEAAAAMVPEFMEDTGQRIRTSGTTVNTGALVGLAGSGVPLEQELDWTPVRANQAIDAGATPVQARSAALDYLAFKTMTAVLDIARSSEQLSMSANGSPGYIRMVNGGACGRCVVQAGKWFRTNTGFLRHPRCRCVHIPARESIAGSWQTDPKAYFDSLNDQQRIKLMGSKANAQAVVDGADINQLVNAYRRTSGMRFAQVSPIKRRFGNKYTTEGATRRGVAAQQQAGLRRNGTVQPRLMPETIYRVAKDQADAQRLLRLYGWIGDDAARARGRATFTEVRRVERNARRRVRAAQQRAAEGPPFATPRSVAP